MARARFLGLALVYFAVTSLFGVASAQEFALVGSASVAVRRSLTEAWVDPGVVCRDAQGADVAFTKTGFADRSARGIYEISYACLQGSKTREVLVSEPIAYGSDAVTVPRGAFGAAWEDTTTFCLSGDPSSAVKTEAVMSPATVYIDSEKVVNVTYTCKDHLEVAPRTRTVQVRETLIVHLTNPIVVPEGEAAWQFNASDAECIDDAGLPVPVEARPPSVVADRPKAVLIEISCRGRTVLAHRQLLVVPQIELGANPLMVQRSVGSWTEEGGICLDTAGQPENLITVPSSVTLLRETVHAVQYRCQHRKPLLRIVDVRDPLRVLGGFPRILALSPMATWAPPSAECVEGGASRPVALEGAVDLAAAGTASVSLTCQVSAPFSVATSVRSAIIFPDELPGLECVGCFATAGGGGGRRLAATGTGRLLSSALPWTPPETDENLGLFRPVEISSLFEGAPEYITDGDTLQQQCYGSGEGNWQSNAPQSISYVKLRNAQGVTCSRYCASNYPESPELAAWTGSCCAGAVDAAGQRVGCNEVRFDEVTCTCAREPRRPFDAPCRCPNGLTFAAEAGASCPVGSVELTQSECQGVPEKFPGAWSLGVPFNGSTADAPYGCRGEGGAVRWNSGAGSIANHSSRLFCKMIAGLPCIVDGGAGADGCDAGSVELTESECRGVVSRTLFFSLGVPFRVRKGSFPSGCYRVGAELIFNLADSGTGAPGASPLCMPSCMVPNRPPTSTATSTTSTSSTSTQTSTGTTTSSTRTTTSTTRSSTTTSSTTLTSTESTTVTTITTTTGTSTTRTTTTKTTTSTSKTATSTTTSTTTATTTTTRTSTTTTTSTTTSTTTTTTITTTSTSRTTTSSSTTTTKSTTTTSKTSTTRTTTTPASTTTPLTTRTSTTRTTTSTTTSTRTTTTRTKTTTTTSSSTTSGTTTSHTTTTRTSTTRTSTTRTSTTQTRTTTVTTSTETTTTVTTKTKTSTTKTTTDGPTTTTTVRRRRTTIMTIPWTTTTTTELIVEPPTSTRTTTSTTRRPTPPTTTTTRTTTTTLTWTSTSTVTQPRFFPVAKRTTKKSSSKKSGTKKSGTKKSSTGKTGSVKTGTGKTGTGKTGSVKTATKKTATSKTATVKTATKKTATVKASTVKAAPAPVAANWYWQYYQEAATATKAKSVKAKSVKRRLQLAAPSPAGVGAHRRRRSEGLFDWRGEIDDEVVDLDQYTCEAPLLGIGHGCADVPWTGNGTCGPGAVCDKFRNPAWQYCGAGGVCVASAAEEDAGLANFSFPAMCEACLAVAWSVDGRCGPDHGGAVCDARANRGWVHCGEGGICGVEGAPNFKRMAATDYDYRTECNGYRPPWAIVNLASSAMISSVDVYPRCDGSTDESGDVEIYVGEGAVWQRCGEPCAPDPGFGGVCKVICSPLARGRQVRIQKAAYRQGRPAYGLHLSLGEVKVFGQAPSEVKWFETTSGWRYGGSWDDAEDLCRGKGMRLCTKREICPGGSVSQGAKPGIAWVAVAGGAKPWAQVGADLAQCVVQSPEWGNRTDEAVVGRGHAACCVQGGVVVAEPSDGVACDGEGTDWGAVDRRGAPWSMDSCINLCKSSLQCRFARFDAATGRCHTLARCDFVASPGAFLWQKQPPGSGTVGCAEFCRGQGKVLVGLHAGGDCACLDALPNGTRVGDAECGVPCAGEDGMSPTRRCGAPGRQAVYRRAPTTPAVPDHGLVDLPAASTVPPESFAPGGEGPKCQDGVLHGQACAAECCSSMCLASSACTHFGVRGGECFLAYKGCLTTDSTSTGWSIYERRFFDSTWHDDFDYLDKGHWSGFVEQSFTVYQEWKPYCGMHAAGGQLLISGAHKTLAVGPRAALYRLYGDIEIAFTTTRSAVECPVDGVHVVELSTRPPRNFTNLDEHSGSLRFVLACGEKSVRTSGGLVVASPCEARLRHHFRIGIPRRGNITFQDAVCGNLSFADDVFGIDGGPLYLTVGARNDFTWSGYDHISVRSRSPQPRCCSRGPDDTPTTVVLRNGTFGSPPSWTPPVADCVRIPGQPLDFARRFLPATAQPNVISTTTTGRHNVTYVCEDPSGGWTATRSRTVEVRDAIEINGARIVSARKTPGGVWRDPGATCIGPLLQPLPIVASATSVPLDEAGESVITYTCTHPARGETVSDTRQVLVFTGFALIGANPQVALAGSPYMELGAACLDFDGSSRAWALDPASPDTSSPGELLLTYRCVLTDGTTDVLQRTLVLSGGAPQQLGFRGSTHLLAVAGGENFADPGACCIDRFGQIIGQSVLVSSFLRDLVAPQQLTHRCANEWGSKTDVRVVSVNSRPRLTLAGLPVARVPADSKYEDGGATCMDAEDGVVPPLAGALGELRPLPFRHAGVGGVEHIAHGVPESVFDGITEGAGTSCGGCLRIVAGRSLWLDLGAERVVHEVRLYGNASGLRLRVGRAASLPAVGAECASAVGVVYGAARVVRCRAPLLGRYVSVEAPGAALICEAQAIGTPPPALPAAVTLRPPAGCSAIPAGRYAFSGAVAAVGAQYTEGASGATLAREAVARRDRAAVAVRAVLPGGAALSREDVEVAMRRNVSLSEVHFARQWRGGAEIWQGRVILDFSGASVGVASHADASAKGWLAEDVLEFDPVLGWTLSNAFVKQRGLAFTFSSAGVAARVGVSSFTVHAGSISGGNVQLALGPAAGAGCSATLSSSGALTSSGLPAMSVGPKDDVVFQRQGADIVIRSGPAVFRECRGMGGGTLSVKISASAPAVVELEDVSFGSSRAFHVVYVVGGRIAAACGRAPGTIVCAAADPQSCWQPDAPVFGESQWESFHYRPVLGRHGDPALQRRCPQAPGSEAPAWATADGSDPCRALGCYRGGAEGEPGREAWVLRVGPEAVAVAHSSSAAPPPEGWVALAGGAACAGTAATSDPEDACTWLMGFGSADGRYRCADGSECTSEGCCLSLGGVAMCPPDRPMMCEDKCTGDHCCADTCGAAGPRRCLQGRPPVDEASRYRCHERDVRITGPTVGQPAPALDAFECQERCRASAACQIFNLRGGVCTLLASESQRDASPGAFSGPARCSLAQRSIIAGEVDTASGDQKVVGHVCTDAFGASSVAARIVKITCESANAGGNVVDCARTASSRTGVSTFDECASECLKAGVASCEAVMFFEATGTCSFRVSCSGRYSSDGGSQQAAYCRYPNRPPVLTIFGDPQPTVRQGESWPVPAAVCNDEEDGRQTVPANDASTAIDKSTAGMYSVTFQCADSAGLTASKSLTVLVLSDCETPGVACQEGAGPFKHLDVCSPSCGYGREPVRPQVTCNTSSPGDFMSRWTPEAPACRVKLCAEPPVPNAMALPSGEPRPCGESDGSGFLGHNSTCTASCAAGFVPTSDSLKCLDGSFQPATFACIQPATPPPSIFSTQQGVLTAPLQWTAGAANACEFSAWQVQVREHGAPGAVWADAPGCQGLSARTSRECVATGLQEGATYEYRVREMCRDLRLSSAYTTSAPIAQRAVPAPVPTTLVPAAGAQLYTAPTAVVVVFSALVRLGGAGSLVVERSGLSNACPAAEFTLPGASILSTPPVLPGTGGLSNGKILTVRPPVGFFAAGCRFSFTVAEGLVVAEDVVAKPNPLFTWVSDVRAVEPRLEKILVQNMQVTTEGVRATVETRYDLATIFSCSITAPQPEQQPLFAGPRPQGYPEGLTWGPQWQPILPTVAGPIAQTLVAETKSYSVVGLVPGKDYTIGCGGTAASSTWVLTQCEGIIGSTCDPKPFRTLEDTNADISTVEVRKFGVCEDGTERLLEEPSLLPAESIATDVTLKLNEYEKACLPPGATLRVGQTVRLIARVNITMESKYAFVKLPRLQGWESSLSVTKQFFTDGEVRQLNQDVLSFEACPHAAIASGASCVPYSVPVTAVDVRVAVTGINIGGFSLSLGRRLAGDPSKMRGEVGVGQLVSLGMNIDPSVNASLLGVWLGPRERGFLQRVSVSPVGNLEFNADGIGRNLPLYLVWEGVLFNTQIVLSFKWPKIALHPIRSGALGRELLLANITEGAPTRTDHTATMFSSMRLSVSKRLEGMPSPGLCIGAQSFSQGWGQVQCSVAMVFIEDVSAFLEVMDFETGKWVFAEGTEHFDVITYKRPKLLELAWKGKEDGPAELVDLSLAAPGKGTTNETNATSAPLSRVLVAKGSGFLDMSALWHIVSYIGEIPQELLMMAEDESGDAAKLCSHIEVLSPIELECTLAPTIDARKLAMQPPLVVQVGEVRSLELLDRLRLPAPIFLNVTGPGEFFDIGVNEFEIAGIGFGVPLDDGVPFETASADWLAAGHRPVGYVQLFANTFAQVGYAPCRVTYQADATLLCTTTEKLREARFPPEASEPRGKMKHEEWTPIIMSVGPYIGGRVGQAKTLLFHCEEGETRKDEDTPECVPCREGFFSNQLAKEWPLDCDKCARAFYQDELGQRECKACPDNTDAPEGSTEVVACTCVPGFYSPFVDEDGVSTVPGKPCSKCHSEVLLATPPKGLRCDNEAVAVQGEVCDASAVHQCVPINEGSTDFRLCKLYCPGGNVFPQAKKYFFSTGRAALRATSDADSGAMFRPTTVLCNPPEACGSINRCAEGYEGKACGECIFGYYRDKLLETCMPCTDGQIIGMIVMAAFTTMIAAAAFFASLLYLKCLSDPIFRYFFFQRVRALVTENMHKSLTALKFRLTHKRVKVRIVQEDCATWWPYVHDKDIGLVFRVDEETRTIHVAGVRSGSPAKSAGIQMGWRLQIVNGAMIGAGSEQEVVMMMQNMSMPLTMTFYGNRFKYKDEDLDEVDLTFTGARVVNARSDREGKNRRDREAELSTNFVRTVVMCLGILQAFNAVARLDLTRTDIFNTVAIALQQLLLNFDFFHPECSVKAPYEIKWFFFTTMPYWMFVPLTLSFQTIRVFRKIDTLEDAQFAKVQSWLTYNAWARASLAILLVFIQVHMEQLSSPMNCFTRDDGTVVMALAQDIACDVSDSRYAFILTFSIIGWLLLAGIFGLLMWAVMKSFLWQFGTRMRNMIPLFVAVVEMSAIGMKGYIRSVRTRVFHNIVAAQTYPIEGLPEDIKVSGMIEAGETVETDFHLDTATILAKENFRHRHIWADRSKHDRGTPLTYGWVLIINTFIRQFSLMISVLWSSLYPALGAGFQCMLFSVNFALLIVVMPYQSERLNFEEALLLALLASLTGGSMFREMILDHKRAQRFPGTTRVSASVIDIVVIAIIVIIILILLRAFYILFKMFAARPSLDDALNKAYFTRRVADERALTEEERGLNLRQRAEDRFIWENTPEGERAWKRQAVKRVKLEVRDIIVELDESGAHATMDIVNQLLKPLNSDVYKDKDDETYEAARYLIAELQADADRKDRDEKKKQAARDAAERQKKAANAMALQRLRAQHDDDKGAQKGARRRRRPDGTEEEEEEDEYGQLRMPLFTVGTPSASPAPSPPPEADGDTAAAGQGAKTRPRRRRLGSDEDEEEDEEEDYGTLNLPLFTRGAPADGDGEGAKAKGKKKKKRPDGSAAEDDDADDQGAASGAGAAAKGKPKRRGKRGTESSEEEEEEEYGTMNLPLFKRNGDGEGDGTAPGDSAGGPGGAAAKAKPRRRGRRGAESSSSEEEEEEEYGTLNMPLFKRGPQGEGDKPADGAGEEEEERRQRRRNMAEERQKKAANAMALTTLRAQAEQAMGALEKQRKKAAEKQRYKDKPLPVAPDAPVMPPKFPFPFPIAYGKKKTKQQLQAEEEEGEEDYVNVNMPLFTFGRKSIAAEAVLGEGALEPGVLQDLDARAEDNDEGEPRDAAPGRLSWDAAADERPHHDMRPPALTAEEQDEIDAAAAIMARRRHMEKERQKKAMNAAAITKLRLGHDDALASLAWKSKKEGKTRAKAATMDPTPDAPRPARRPKAKTGNIFMELARQAKEPDAEDDEEYGEFEITIEKQRDAVDFARLMGGHLDASTILPARKGEKASQVSSSPAKQSSKSFVFSSGGAKAKKKGASSSSADLKRGASKDSARPVAAARGGTVDDDDLLDLDAMLQAESRRTVGTIDRIEAAAGEAEEEVVSNASPPKSRGGEGLRQATGESKSSGSSTKPLLSQDTAASAQSRPKFASKGSKASKATTQSGASSTAGIDLDDLVGEEEKPAEAKTRRKQAKTKTQGSKDASKKQ